MELSKIVNITYDSKDLRTLFMLIIKKDELGNQQTVLDQGRVVFI